MAFLQAPVENTSQFVVTLAPDSTGSVAFFLSGTTSRAANLSLKRVRLNDTGFTVLRLIADSEFSLFGSGAFKSLS